MNALQRQVEPLSSSPHIVGTSAAGAMLSTKRSKSSVSTVKISGYPFIDNTVSDAGLNVQSLDLKVAYPVIFFFFASESTGHGEVASNKEAELQTNEATRKAISQLRRLSGLTWDQLAYLFAVSRRSVHLWMSGKPMNAANEERLHKILPLLKEVDRGNADENRKLLLTPTEGEQRPIDLLAKEEFEKVREMLGAGDGRRRSMLTPLSASAWEARLPPKPEQLVDARHEPVHKELGVARVARTKRNKG